MTPILEKLKEEYKGVLQVDFIDVWKNKDAAAKYNIQTIPTQIFFNAKGEEFDRHIGFISKEDILKRFKKLLKRK
jgi:thioredoxin 1